MRLEQIFFISIDNLYKTFNLFLDLIPTIYLNNLDPVFSDLREIYKVWIKTPENRSNN